MDPPTTEKLDLIIEAFEDSRFIEPWFANMTIDEKREKLLEWLASTKRPMRIMRGPRWYERTPI